MHELAELAEPVQEAALEQDDGFALVMVGDLDCVKGRGRLSISLWERARLLQRRAIAARDGGTLGAVVTCSSHLGLNPSAHANNSHKGMVTNTALLMPRHNWRVSSSWSKGFLIPK